MKEYLKDRGKLFFILLCLWCFADFYLAFLCASNVYFQDLLYLNLLFLAASFAGILWDFYRFKKTEKYLEGRLSLTPLEQEKLFGKRVSAYMEEKEEEHKKEIRHLLREQEELTDYIGKWSHEAKLPLAALKLINERNQDREASREMKNSIARLESLIHTVMLGSKLHRPEHDVRYEKGSLKKAVGEAVKNQSYFLIHHNFEIKEETGKIQVYTDKRWLVYLLDQLIQNAVKYRGEAPALSFAAQEKGKDSILLIVEDNGVGIEPEDLPYIFQKGYVGKNYRKGDYRSTGMGLYFVKEISQLLHTEIRVFSEPEKGTRFEIRFQDLSEHLLLSE